MSERQWLGIFGSIGDFSESKAKEQCVKRFSEKGEVDNYGQTYNRRGDVLANKFIKNRNARILDVGCASGKVAFTLARYGYQIDGIDISAEMIKKANELKKTNKVRNVSFNVGDAEFLNVKNKYDCVLGLFNLLTYTPKREIRFRILDNMVNALNKDGILIMDTINGRGSPRLILKQLFFKVFFLISGKNRPFGDVISNPMFSNSKEVLFQHYLSRGELEDYLKNIKGISYNIDYYDVFADKKSRRCLFIVIKKNQ